MSFIEDARGWQFSQANSQATPWTRFISGFSFCIVVGTIVGAIVGFGLVGIGPEAVNWSKIAQIVASWVISPAVGGVISFLLMVSIHRLILEKDASGKPTQTTAVRYIPKRLSDGKFKLEQQIIEESK